MQFSLFSILALAATSTAASTTESSKTLETRANTWSWTPYAGSSCTGSGTGAWIQGFTSSPCYNVATVSRVKIVTDTCTLTAYTGVNCPSREFGTTYTYGSNVCVGNVSYKSFKVNCLG
ncbi:hypothetical protein QBC38DRAFT_378449 [Podospora fimiseda]|uniref:Uncharacterized protein n=1 Tax=Podospora fimiseda TaxID=252190 RepID=A0AAN7BGC1_9PEZI|nr:hypothetical protein QBC38DRAFT_378449 [Podospora fimiseda]